MDTPIETTLNEIPNQPIPDQSTPMFLSNNLFGLNLSDWRHWVLIIFATFVILYLVNPKPFNDFANNVANSVPNIRSANYENNRTELEISSGGPVIMFEGTGSNQEDRLTLVNHGTEPARVDVDYLNQLGESLSSLETTYGSAAIDMEKLGHTDLFVARQDGVYFYKNNVAKELPFSMKKIMEKRPGLTPYHITIHDFDRDGNPDIFIRQFHDNNPKEDGPSVILHYTHPYAFEDITGKFEYANLTQKVQSDDTAGDKVLQIKLPPTIDYAGARVAVIIGNQMYVKYNVLGTGQARLLTFNFSGMNIPFVDKVRIRTIYNKDKYYLEVPFNRILEVDPVVKYEHTQNKWKMVSDGA